MNRDQPYNDLPPLPPLGNLETTAVLKKAIAANRRLAELKGEIIYTPPEGESVIRDKRSSLFTNLRRAWIAKKHKNWHRKILYQ